MLFSSSLVNGLFDFAIVKTISHLKSILRQESLKNNKTILMVGGLSDSYLLQGAVETEFGSYTLIVPLDPSTAVLRGPVIIGHNPKAISKWKLKKSYGVKNSSSTVR